MSEKVVLPAADVKALTEDLFRKIHQHRHDEKIPLNKKSIFCSLTNLLPILKWLPSYTFRESIMPDIVAGLTVAIMHIPHGLAYAPLAGQAPVVGLYMAVFPTVIYLILGTSRHISLGTFAIICMMVGKSVSEQTMTLSSEGNQTLSYSNLEVSVSICFMVGLWQFLMGLLHMGCLWLILSNSLVSGFTTGATVHVITYQIKNLLGVPANRFSGPLKWLYLVIDLIYRVPDTNLVTFGVSFCAIVVLSFYNEVVKSIIRKKIPNLKVPIPMELIVIILGIAVSYFMDLEGKYQVEIVKNVPVGLPEPVLPVPDLFPSILVDSFVIAVVGISMSLSLAAIFAKEHGYEIKKNQELLAYGASNIFSSFFQCIPSSASLSRSLVQSSVGGKSQISSVFTMATIILILLFLGPFFEPVPYCILSSIVVVTLKGLLWQIKDFPHIWKLSKLDGTVWLVAFLSVVLIDLDIGLGIGLIMSGITLILRGQTPTVVQLGRIPNSNIFVDVNLYKSSKTLPKILILKITGGLHFANFSTLHDNIIKFYHEFRDGEKGEVFLILDMGCVPSIDPAAVGGLLSFYKELKIESCSLILTDCTEHVYNSLGYCHFFEELPKSIVFFSTIDAVEYLST